MNLIFPSDPHPRRLEHRALSRNEANESLGCVVLRGPDDLRQLRPLQLVGRHPR